MFFTAKPTECLVFMGYEITDRLAEKGAKIVIFRRFLKKRLLGGLWKLLV